MSLSSLGLQKTFTDKIKSHLRSGRIGSSYILAGSNDRKPKELALEIAKALNCESLPSDGCETCSNCRVIMTNAHLDVKFYDPGNLRFGIGLARQIQSDSMESNYSAKWRVNILVGASSMTIEAQNALLKLLEEGRHDCINLFLVETLETILPTILSRSAVLRLPPLPENTAAKILENVGFDSATSICEARESNSNIGIATWVQQNRELADKSLKVLTSIGSGSMFDALTLSDKDDEIENVVALFNEVIRRATLIRSGVGLESSFLHETAKIVAAFDEIRFKKIKQGVREIEKLWRTQTKKAQLLQVKLLQCWM